MPHNAEKLSCYLKAHETIDEYLARTDMHSSSVWATEVEKFAVFNMLRTPIMVFCQSGHSYSGYTFCHIHVKTAMLCMRIPKKLFIWSIHVTTMNLLGECDIGLAHIY